MEITSRKPGDGGETRIEVEVCKEKNPWQDVCDVYSCKEDWSAMQSICTYRYTYNKDCMTETCSGS